MLTNANVQMGNLHLSRRNVDFSKFIFPDVHTRGPLN